MTRLPRPGIVVTEKPKDTLHPPSSFIRHDVPLICRFDQSISFIKVNGDVASAPGRCLSGGRCSVRCDNVVLRVVGDGGVVWKGGCVVVVRLDRAGVWAVVRMLVKDCGMSR